MAKISSCKNWLLSEQQSAVAELEDIPLDRNFVLNQLAYMGKESLKHILCERLAF